MCSFVCHDLYLTYSLMYPFERALRVHVQSLQVACATLELVFLFRERHMKAPASISLGRSTP